MSWIHFNPNTQNLKQWLENYKPSKISQLEASWIYVQNAIVNVTTGDEQGAMKEWFSIVSTRNPTTEDVDSIARKYNILEGKWMIFSKTSVVDEMWAKVAEATVAGAAGILSAKVSPKSGDGSHVMCVYTADYLNQEDVLMARLALEQIGFKGNDYPFTNAVDTTPA